MPQRPRPGLPRMVLRPALFLFLLALPGLPLIGAAGFFIGHSVAAAHRARPPLQAHRRAARPTPPALPVLRSPALAPPAAGRLVAAARTSRRPGPSTGPGVDRPARAPVHARARYLWAVPVAAPGRVSRHTAGSAGGAHGHRAAASHVEGKTMLFSAAAATPHRRDGAPRVVARLVRRTRVKSALAMSLAHAPAAARARMRQRAPAPSSPYALPVPPVLARAAYLYDVTSGVLYAKDAEVALPMASTTKIMTALLAITYGHLDDLVTASPAAATIGESSMYLLQGETVTLRDLLYGLMLPSGNDAAIAIAEHVGGSVPNFVAMMNREAAALGMVHTHFATPHGLDAADHYASARDMALLAMAAMRLPAFRQIVSTRHYYIPATAHNYAHDLYNINQPLWWYPGVVGLKPGSTGAAGRCAVEWVVRGDRALLLVLLGGGNLVTDVRDLLNWGFGDFSRWYSPTLVPVYYAPEYLGWDGPGLWLPTADGGRYYALTGHTVRGALLARYLTTGGLARYGAPTSEESIDARGVWRQRFAASWLFYNPRTRLSAPTEGAVG